MTPDDARKRYETETGLPWSDVEGVRWLNEIWPLGLEQRSVKHRSVYASLSDKASWILQQPCQLCRPDVPIHVLPLRLAPQSWQYLSSVNKKAFLAALEHHFSKRIIAPITGKICLRFVFVCSETRRRKDLDNMAKAFMDGVKHFLMRDDRDVDHLDLIRLTHDGNEEFVALRISASNLDERTDLVYPGLMHGWAGAQELRLEDYRERF